MKPKELEALLLEQTVIRLKKIETLSDQEDRRKTLNEIEQLNKMRSEIHSDRSDRIQRYIQIGVQTGIPAIVTVAMGLMGYSLEGLFGNVCSNTLKGIISRSPKM